MAEKWHDINAPGVWQKPNQDTPQSGSTQPADAAATDAPAQEPEKPLIKLSEGKFVPPAEGVAINKKCPVQVNVEYLDDSAKSMQKVTFSLYANYQDAVSNLSHYVDGYEKDGVAQAEMTMYPPPGYKEGDNVDYFFKAEHIRGEKIIDSEDLTLPMETKSINLQKGDYDENGAQKYDKEQSGDNFKPNNAVKKLQGDLITTIFLPKSSDDGFFGDQTDKAVRSFEDYAIKPDRMKQKVGKLEKADKTFEKPQPDGIVDQKTRDELDKWLHYGWIKPIPPLRLGDFDDEGVKNNKGERGGEDYFQGTLVLDLHKLLATVGAYLGKQDGWFGDITHSALKLFQDHASKGDMVDINGNQIQLSEQDRLKGHTVGVTDAPTQEALKQCQEKKIKVPPIAKKEDFVSVDDGNKIIEIAKKWIGTPYETGGETKKGADCSGSVNGIYGEAGFYFERGSSYDFPANSHFKEVPANIPQPGDVGYWPGHLMIYDENAGQTHKGEIANGWSASHPNGPTFDVARFQWFDTHYNTKVKWYRYLINSNGKQ